jgi:hypothetical protein
VPGGPDEEVAAVQVRWCSDCQDERMFEVPPCEDGHGEDCLDLACVDCGAAVVVGVLMTHAHVVLEVRAA